ncbi:hypothetical protein ACWEKT_06935 [Nocardia takedensis]|uniref:hypothetical protein n=1 Tax=Nocardia takedensis TaxID=259390 RepID=UPI0002FB20AC|nr:hypothetical protein [Nocardia takedensis]
MAVRTPPSLRPPKIELGTAWLASLIVSTLTAGVVLLSVSALTAVIVACAMVIALVIALGSI